MKKALLGTIIGLSVLACPLAYVFVGPALTPLQIEVLKTLLTICGCSAAYCFFVGELAHNNSQMDKLWSLLPEIYIWIMAAKSGFDMRLVIMAVIATIWGIRLTYNFARKGAYSWKFWSGEEDYRWAVVRSRQEFQPAWKWTVFDLFFISIYQNVLVLLTTMPALVVMGADQPLNWLDIVAALLMLGFVLYEAVADEQQWHFQTKKHELLRSGKKLEEMPEPYRKGFNTRGLWTLSRHPNYFAEQGTWCAFYIFSIAAGIGIFNWSIIGALLLIVLFLGSSALAEEISSSKYPEYAYYQRTVSKFFPFFKVGK